MELRKVEQSLDNLTHEWKSLRCKELHLDCDVYNSQYQDGSTALNVHNDFPNEPTKIGMYDLLPSLTELLSQVKDVDIFPPEEPSENLIIEVEKVLSSTDTKIESMDNEKEEEMEYFEWGMLTTIPSRHQSTQIETPKQLLSSKVNHEIECTDDEIDEMITTLESASPHDILYALQSLRQNLDAIQPKVNKFLTRLSERDPVTKKRRYGANTVTRIKRLIRVYQALENGLIAAYQLENDTIHSSLVQLLENQIHINNQRLIAKEQVMKTQQQIELDKIESQRLLVEQLAKDQYLQELQKQEKEERELAQRAQEARLRRLEEQQRVMDVEAEADREFLASVPIKGPMGVRIQINRMREALKEDTGAIQVALGSLYILFDQIVRKPEEVNFRRIRRDHPKFMDDIGRHVGGREVLIAAGFHLETLDGVPSFFSKEPHIESDMDGWSEWFDGLKKVLEVIEEEMVK